MPVEVRPPAQVKCGAFFAGWSPPPDHGDVVGQRFSFGVPALRVVSRVRVRIAWMLRGSILSPPIERRTVYSRAANAVVECPSNVACSSPFGVTCGAVVGVAAGTLVGGFGTGSVLLVEAATAADTRIGSVVGGTVTGGIVVAGTVVCG